MKTLLFLSLLSSFAYAEDSDVLTKWLVDNCKGCARFEAKMTDYAFQDNQYVHAPFMEFKVMDKNVKARVMDMTSQEVTLEDISMFNPKNKRAGRFSTTNDPVVVVEMAETFCQEALGKNAKYVAHSTSRTLPNYEHTNIKLPEGQTFLHGITCSKSSEDRLPAGK